MNKERFEALNDYLHTLSSVPGKRNDEIDAVISEIHKELNVEVKAKIDVKSDAYKWQVADPGVVKIVIHQEKDARVDADKIYKLIGDAMKRRGIK